MDPLLDVEYSLYIFLSKFQRVR